MKKLIATLLMAGALTLGAIPATASQPCIPCEGRDLIKGVCPEVPGPVVQETCYTQALLRIAEREHVRVDPRFQTVTVNATNTNHIDAEIIVTYQAGRLSNQPQTVLRAAFDTTFGISFEVPRFRDVDGLVIARIVGICDGSVTVELH